MNPSSRILIVLMLLGILLVPLETMAKVGRQDEYTPPPPPTIEEGGTASGAVLEAMRQAEILKWNIRRNSAFSFWENMMNNRSFTKSYRSQVTERRAKRRTQRIACRISVSKANRNTVLAQTEQCVRAMLTLDLEGLRKEKQIAMRMAGISDEMRGTAVFHIDNLMDAISTIVEAIDAGVYGTNEELRGAKRNLTTHFRQAKRLAMTKLRINRTQTWLTHLMVRLRDIEEGLNPDPEVTRKIEETIACLESKNDLLSGLMEVEDNSALITSFRQAQSEVKFCIDLARGAKSLNTEFEQAAAENS